MIKFTDKGQEQRSERLADLRKRVAKLKRIESNKDSLAWKELKSLLEDFVETEKTAQRRGVIACAMGGYYDMKEGALRPMTDSRLVSDLRVGYEREQAFQLMIDLVEKTDIPIEHIENTIKGIEETYKTAKDQLE